MNAEHMRRNEGQLSTIARKILTIVPSDAPMAINDIAAELFRVTRARVDKDVLTGCLNTLVTAGLIKERQRGTFRRIDITPADTASESAIAETVDVDTPPPPKPEPPIMRVVKLQETFFDKFARVAAEMRTASILLAKHADLIEEAALDAQKAIDDEKEKNKKFDQLRQLLKGIEA